MKKVLIIGANSYIGQNFKKYIDNRPYENISVSLVSASDGSWKKADFSAYDVILHLSGIVHKKENKKMKALYYNVNYKLAKEVAEKAKENHVRQFIFMSTAAVYDPRESCITKDTVPHPVTYYGMSKLAAERAIIQLQSDSFLVAVIRSPMVYGRNCKGNYQRLLQLARYLPFFPDYHNKRSMIRIDNLCKMMFNIIQKEKCGYFCPQDERYADTCRMFVSLRKSMGKRTFLLRKMDGIIRALIPHSNIIRKMFGDFYYT